MQRLAARGRFGPRGAERGGRGAGRAPRARGLGAARGRGRVGGARRLGNSPSPVDPPGAVKWRRGGGGRGVPGGSPVAGEKNSTTCALSRGGAAGGVPRSIPPLDLGGLGEGLRLTSGTANLGCAFPRRSPSSRVGTPYCSGRSESSRSNLQNCHPDPQPVPVTAPLRHQHGPHEHIPTCGSLPGISCTCYKTLGRRRQVVKSRCLAAINAALPSQPHFV